MHRRSFRAALSIDSSEANDHRSSQPRLRSYEQARYEEESYEQTINTGSYDIFALQNHESIDAAYSGSYESYPEQLYEQPYDSHSYPASDVYALGDYERIQREAYAEDEIGYARVAEYGQRELSMEELEAVAGGWKVGYGNYGVSGGWDQERGYYGGVNTPIGGVNGGYNPDTGHYDAHGDLNVGVANIGGGVNHSAETGNTYDAHLDAGIKGVGTVGVDGTYNSTSGDYTAGAHGSFNVGNESLGASGNAGIHYSSADNSVHADANVEAHGNSPAGSFNASADAKGTYNMDDGHMSGEANFTADAQLGNHLVDGHADGNATYDSNDGGHASLNASADNALGDHVETHQETNFATPQENQVADNHDQAQPLADTQQQQNPEPFENNFPETPTQDSHEPAPLVSDNSNNNFNDTSNNQSFEVAQNDAPQQESFDSGSGGDGGGDAFA